MSEGLNRVMLLGNLGADPELRMTTAGTAVLNLRLATSESYLDKDKKRRDRVEWHRIVIFGKRAEGLGKILQKGDRLFVEGSNRTTSYEDKDKKNRYITEIVASNVLLNGSGKGAPSGQSSDGYTPRGGARGRPDQGDEGYGDQSDDEPLPF